MLNKENNIYFQKIINIYLSLISASSFKFLLSQYCLNHILRRSNDLYGQLAYDDVSRNSSDAGLGRPRVYRPLHQRSLYA